ncbi:MAG TPA: PAS domain-containing protein, partial [candidate division Zixibacteria bacterium]|nr:PAS domain-containing protein [candidate division Zixibacteria bacterium]
MKTTSDIIEREQPGEEVHIRKRTVEPIAAAAPLVVTEPPDAEVLREALRRGRPLTFPRPAGETPTEGRDPARGKAVLLALDHLDIGLFLVNRQGYITDCNEAGSELLGIDHTTPWENRHVSNLTAVFPGDVYDQFDRLLSGDRACVRREIAISGPGARPLAVTLCAVPLPDQAAEIVGIVREASADQNRRAHDEFSILAEVAAALSSSLELRQILRIILTGATASQGLGFNRAFLFLFDRDRHELTAHMAVGPTSAEEAGRIWTRLAGMHLSLAQLLDVHP